MTKNPKNSSADTHTRQSEGNFATGLFVGVITGALGMFLFGTDRGQELIQNLKEELAKENDDGETPVDQTRTLIAQVVNEAKNVVSEANQAVQTKVDSKLSSANKKPAKENNLFPKFKRKK